MKEPITVLRADPENPRDISSDAAAGLRHSMSDFGDLSGIVWNRTTGELVTGHQRVTQLTGDGATDVQFDDRDPSRGWILHPRTNEFFPVRIVEWERERQRAANLVANSPAIAGQFTALAVEQLKQLEHDSRFDALKLGELEQQLKDRFAEVARMARGGGLTDPDAAMPPPSEPVAKRGQLWTLGDHRLLCGDSTVAADVARALGGEKAALCLTDPPYGIGESYSSFDDTPENLTKLITGFMPLAVANSNIVLLTPGNSNQRSYPKPTWTLAWVVPAGSGMNPWGFTCWQPVLAYGKDPYLANGMGSRPDVLVKTESAENSLGHPCPKPVGIWKWFMERGSILAGDVIYEPFCGSGTTIIAAEMTGRRCRAIELDPRYVDVAVQRWQQFTGQRATVEPA